MQPKLVTFDCANTLIWTDWQPHTFAVRCAEIAGLELPDGASEKYMEIFLPKLPEFWLMNQKRSFLPWREFWVQQVADWLAALGIEGQNPLELHLIGEKEIFRPPSKTFKLFDDALPAVRALQEMGIKVAVLSNWDHSLHQCLEGHGLGYEFDAVFASLEHGVEKPDPRFFQIALDHFGVTPSECFHVGDDPIDDFEGATQAGIPVALLDRTRLRSEKPYISDLHQLIEAFEWYV
ncbi:MAG: HAD-IA family hydrolase [Armatimonadota bacterium]